MKFNQRIFRSKIREHVSVAWMGPLKGRWGTFDALPREVRTHTQRAEGRAARTSNWITMRFRRVSCRCLLKEGNVESRFGERVQGSVHTKTMFPSSVSPRLSTRPPCSVSTLVYLASA